MDDIATRIRARFDHAAAKKNLAEKYEAKMLFAHAGGMWRTGPELLNILEVLGEDENAVLLDVYGTPVQINVPEMSILAKQRWQEIMNAWLEEWNQLQRQR